MTASRLTLKGTRLSALLICAALGCGEITITDTRAEVRNCRITYDSGFPTDGDFNIDMPTSCPFKLAGQTLLDYAANASFPGGSVSPWFYQLTFIDRQGRTSASTVTSSWRQEGNDWQFNAQGQYWAATGGFAADTGYDKADNEFLTTQSSWQSAVATLTYRFGSPAFYIGGPKSGSAYMDYRLSGTTDDPTFHGPTQYEWLVDGNLVSTEPSLEWQTGGPGEVQSIQGKIIDVEGKIHSAYRTMRTCPGTQINC